MRTIPQFFENSVEQYGDNPFLWQKEKDKYESISYSETRDEVYKLALGLKEAGLSKGDRIALISEGRNDWVISELAILYIGAVNVPLSVKLEAFELEFRINHSDAKMIIVSGGQSKKIEQIRSNLTKVEKYIFLDRKDEYADNETNIGTIYKNGEELIKSGNNELESIWKGLDENDYANICYTSGTTADPKGIILSHLNYYANVEQAVTLMTIPPTYRTLLILPLDHSFAHTAGIYSFMRMGASIASVQIGKTLNETLRNIPINIKEIKPAILLSVPALAKNFRKNIEKGIRDKGKKVESFFKFALALSIKYNGLGFDKGKGLKIFMKPLVWLFDKILFSKIKDNFGGELQYFVGGGALLDIDLQKFFYAIGMPMYQGYGLSEAAPIISSNAASKHKLGSSGFLVKNLELKICDDDGSALPVGKKGEIVVKGENVMLGYWKNEKATKETLIDGWLYTGDMGYMDEDGFLYVLGRFKSLLIGHDGEKYSPEGIEEALVELSVFIDQCVLHNNQDPYTVGLIVPNKEAFKRYLKHKKIEINSEEGVSLILDKMQREINNFKLKGKHGGMFPERWLPASTAILTDTFNEQNHLMNSTMKIVRGKINEYYKEIIEYLYTPSSKDIKNEKNIEAVKSLFGLKF